MSTEDKKKNSEEKEAHIQDIPSSQSMNEEHPRTIQDKEGHDESTKELAAPKETKKEKKIKVSERELKELEAKAHELDELKDTFLRKVADYENAKKRLHKEKEEFTKFANERIISSFLPVLDNLDRALAHGSNSVTTEALISGVDLIKKQIFDILKNNGLSKIEAVGQPFDPHLHEAIGKVETDEHHADTIIDEIQCGYVLKNKLLRPSWVRIAAAPKKEAESAPPDETMEIEKDQEEKGTSPESSDV